MNQQPEFDLEHIFTYHAPDEQQREAYRDLRFAARTFAQVLIDRTPVGADQSAAIRLLRECVMTANAAIATGGRLHKLPVKRER